MPSSRRKPTWKVDPDQTIAFTDSVQLPVREVARVLTQGVRIGVACDQRSGRGLGDIPEPFFSDVGEIDEDAERVAGPDQFMPGIRQTFSRVG